MTTAPEPGTVKRALSAHAATGLLTGALLYLVSLTGTLSVFYAEWQRLEQPHAPEMAEIAPEAVQKAVATVIASEAGKPTTTHLFVHMPVADLPRTTITTDHQAVNIAADGSIAGPEEIAWSDFLVNLHYTLNLPGVVGITIVGVLGVMLLALALSGVIAHPRIFRDAFRLRVRSANGLGLADWHNRLSVWGLPFSLAIGLTGALIGMATVTAYTLATVDYDGDVEAVYAPIFGAEGKVDPTPTGLPDVAAALRYMATRYPDVEPTYAILHDPMTAGQKVQIVGTHQRRLIFGEYYLFNASGRFLHTAGLADGALGQQAAASTYKLHFGNFGGFAVKLAYALFGTALTAICATGVYIWLGKRERRGFNQPRLRAAWSAVVWGAPLALIVTVGVRATLGNQAPFATIFWVVWTGLVMVAVVSPSIRKRPVWGD
ncbi:PepSY-associated TM helix domain-containing protein [Croceicoccus bisphenolivorans]|uniref:PepSY-associated TM helix domain-containing protein n=1 Tax=Croceicoccus bisphenolivorans TaxID=1783232 RepID=UPI0008374646|nr:PepSY-associated TM helix domain-containing protein [Croceicoccus bisphenolivorans]